MATSSLMRVRAGCQGCSGLPPGATLCGYDQGCDQTLYLCSFHDHNKWPPLPPRPRRTDHGALSRLRPRHLLRLSRGPRQRGQQPRRALQLPVVPLCANLLSRARHQFHRSQERPENHSQRHSSTRLIKRNRSVAHVALGALGIDLY